MQQNMVSAEFLGLAGVRVALVERETDGSWTVHVTSAPGSGPCCPGCGRLAVRPKEATAHTLKHLVVMPVRVTWHKSIFWCDNSGCEKASFAEAGPLAGAGGRVTEHAKKVMGHLIGDWLVPVSRVATAVGVAWRTGHDGFESVAADAQIVVTDTITSAETTRAETSADHGGPGSAGVVELADRAVRSVTGALPPVRVLGIDDHRRGRPLYHRDPASGKWVADADRWQSVFVDSAGGRGLLGQVEGRAGRDVIAWLAGQDPAWRAAIRWVTVDMSSVYKSAVTTSGLLPGAQLIVDLFHVIQLANKMIGDVRRRVTFERRGRRGRAADPEYVIKGLLVRGRERLSERARHKLLCALADLGEGGRQIGAAWRAKELLRDLVRLSPNQTGLAPTRPQIATALEAFFVFCGTVGGSVPEIQTLAETISLWRAEIARGVVTGHSNAAAEGVNRLVKLVYRTGFGFTNVTNQQRRSRYAASRGTRTGWLSPAWLQETAWRGVPPAMPTPTALPPRERRPGHVDLLGEADDRRSHTVTTTWTQPVAA
ncbi:transposase [Acrocarpospora sp. B8E8]|uniref:transposase n=1 Tax=Acrocarpospora sp. B8E8 TaxID=3153572 RepID=UPI00325D6976